MTDSEPLLFRAQLGALRPANPAAEEAVKSVEGTVRVEIKRTSGNYMRLKWYWVMLRLFLDNTDFFEGPMTPQLLHRWLKRQYGLGEAVVSKATGEEIAFNEGSIAFHNMPENERTNFVDFAANLLSERLGVSVDTLKQEAQAA